MLELRELLQQEYFGNTAWQWTVAAAITVALLLGLWLFQRLVRANYKRLAATPQAEFMELPLLIASRTTGLFVIIAAVFGGLQTLQLPPKVDRVLTTIFTIAAFWQAGLWATTALLASLERKRQASLTVDRAAVGTLDIIGFVARATIWSFVLLLTLDNLGIEIKPLLAGLGIGGIAVALAVQNVLGDLLASLSITLDRPFVVGDALNVDNFSGTVEHIGIKSTRLRSLDGEQIIMPNASLLSSRLRNYTRMSERRVVLNISVSHETSREQLAKIPGLIRALIEVNQNVRFDRAHFAKIGPTSFDFEAVYFVTTADYLRHMDILQNFNLRLIEEFEREGIHFAQPMQRLLLEREPVQSELVSAPANPS